MARYYADDDALFNRLVIDAVGKPFCSSEIFLHYFSQWKTEQSSTPL